MCVCQIAKKKLGDPGGFSQTCIFSMAALREGRSTLSKAWAVHKKHGGLYSGGKVDLFKSFSSSDDGYHVLASMYAEDVSLIDVSTGHVITTLRGSSDNNGNEESMDPIVTFALNPKVPMIVTATRGLLLQQWQLEIDETTGNGNSPKAAPVVRCVRSIRGHSEPMLDMEFDSTGTFVATGSADRSARVWDMRGGFATHNFRGHSGIVNMVRFHPDPIKLLLVTGSEDCSARVWSLNEKTCLATLGCHMSAITSVAFTLDGLTMATGSRDKVVNFWDINNNYTLMKTFPVYEDVEGLCIVSDLEQPAESSIDAERGTKRKRTLDTGTQTSAQGYLACVGSKGIVRIWHFEAKEPADQRKQDMLRCKLVSQQPQSKGACTGYTRLIYYNQHHSLIAVNADHNLLFMDFMSLVPRRQIVGYNDEILHMKYLGDQTLEDADEIASPTRLAVATNSPRLKILHIENFDCDVLDGHEGIILSLDVCPSGRWIITGSKDRTCRVWDTKELLCAMVCVGHMQAVSAVAFSKKKSAYEVDDAFAISGAGDKTIKRWKIDQEQLIATLTEKPNSPLRPTAERNIRAHEKDINHICVAPNDLVIATSSQDRTVKIWTARDLTLAGTLRGHKRGVMASAFSPINRSLITCSADRTLKMWSISDFTCLKTFQGHCASVLAVEFLPDASQVVSCGADGLLKLWTLKTNECEGTFDAHDDKIWTLALRGDGKELATGGGDSLINIWSDVTKSKEDDLLTQAEERALREQGLLSSIHNKDFPTAIELAFDLNHSYRLWGVLSEIAENFRTIPDVNESNEKTGPFDHFIDSWDDDRIFTCFEYIREWNTNAKNAAIAQSLLCGILRRIPFHRLRSIEGVNDIINAIIPYTERHYQRIDGLLQSSFVLDYTLSNISAIDG